MMPNKASDAGPEGRKYCPTCGCAWKLLLADCHFCGTPTCDCCPGAQIDDNVIVCGKCAAAIEVDDLDCDCRFTGDQADASGCRLHQITARVQYAQVPEWDKEEKCPI